MTARCPVCGKDFSDAYAVRQHAKAKHKKRQNIEPVAFNREPSFADMAIEAEQFRDAGIPVPEDIEMAPPMTPLDLEAMRGVADAMLRKYEFGEDPFKTVEEFHAAWCPANALAVLGMFVVDKSLHLPGAEPWYVTQESYDGIVDQNDRSLACINRLIERLPIPNDLPDLIAVADWIADQHESLLARAENAEARIAELEERGR